VSPRFCFLTERQVGIGSAAGAMERYVRAQGNVAWTDVTYVERGGWLERLPLPERSRGTLRGFLQTRAALRAEHFAAQFFLTHNPAVLQQRALRRTPSVLWTDVTPALLDAQAEQYSHSVDRSAALRRFKTEMVRRTFRSAARCVGWSGWAQRSFVRDYGVPEERTCVVPPGVDLARWQPLERVATAELPKLLFVGGHFERKGGDLLLDVFRAHLRGRATLDLVTRDPIAEEEGVRVHRGLTPDSPKLRELYREASVFVLPTRGDCFSIASMEAMATGLPVVVSDVGGIAEIVEHGQSGYLMPVNDGRALRAHLEDLLTDAARRRAFGARGRELVTQRFDAEKTARQLLEIMTEVARPT